jgi:hypothetical protein
MATLLAIFPLKQDDGSLCTECQCDGFGVPEWCEWRSKTANTNSLQRANLFLRGSPLNRPEVSRVRKEGDHDEEAVGEIAPSSANQLYEK